MMKFIERQSWIELFSSIESDINTTIDKVKNENICPELNNVFKCFEFFDVIDTKVVVIGQDPYHTPNTATGLAFQTKNVNKPPPSLHNIYKAVKNAYPNSACDISSWVNQGVLMINRSFTVELNKPNSHYKMWKSITNSMINLLSKHMKAQERKMVFMLWGNNAKELIPFIDNDFHIVLTHTHPSPLSRKSFSNCNHFQECNKTHHIIW